MFTSSSFVPWYNQLLNPSYNSFNSQHFYPWAFTSPAQQKPPNSLVRPLHGAVDRSEHSASQGSETAHLSQQEAHLFSTNLNNPQSIEAPGQHWSFSLYSCPTVAYWPSRYTIPTGHLQNWPRGVMAKTRLLLSTPFPPACQWKSRVKELGQPEWKGLCPQPHWHVYHLPEFYIKGGRRGWQIKIGLRFKASSEYWKRIWKEEIKEAKAVQVRWMGCRWARDMRSEGVSCIWKGADGLLVRVNGEGDCGHRQHWPAAISTLRLYFHCSFSTKHGKWMNVYTVGSALTELYCLLFRFRWSRVKMWWYFTKFCCLNEWLQANCSKKLTTWVLLRVLSDVIHCSHTGINECLIILCNFANSCQIVIYTCTQKKDIGLNYTDPHYLTRRKRKKTWNLWVNLPLTFLLQYKWLPITFFHLLLKWIFIMIFWKVEGEGVWKLYLKSHWKGAKHISAPRRTVAPSPWEQSEVPLSSRVSLTCETTL